MSTHQYRIKVKIDSEGKSAYYPQYRNLTWHMSLFPVIFPVCLIYLLLRSGTGFMILFKKEEREDVYMALSGWTDLEFPINTQLLPPDPILDDVKSYQNPTYDRATQAILEHIKKREWEHNAKVIKRIKKKMEKTIYIRMDQQQLKNRS